MKVVMLLGVSTGGVASHVAQIGARLRDQGVEVMVVTHPITAERFDLNPVRLWWPGSGGWFRTLHDFARLRTLASASDVLHAHGLRAGALGVLAVRSLPRARWPRVVVTLHNVPVGGRSLRAVSAGFERVVARGADVVLGVSGDLVDRTRALGASQCARALVPAPVRPPIHRDKAQVRESLRVHEGDVLLVTVARLAPQKGLDTLSDTSLLLKGRVDAGEVPGATGLTWAVAGEGPLEGYLDRRIETEGLPVVALGRRDDIPDLLAAADLVVSTAVWEGQPIWLQEAMALGAAIVATDVGGTREVTGDGASLVPAGDPASLSDRVVDLLSDRSRAQALREAALERGKELPTTSDVVAQLMAVYTG